MNIYLFGSTTPSGYAFEQAVSGVSLFDSLTSFTRASDTTSHVDLSNPTSYQPALASASDPHICISFAPIWLFSYFLDSLYQASPEYFDSIKGVIACSSSSAITKRFSFDKQDRELSARLLSAEEKLLFLCDRLSVPCTILRPTLIYGCVGPYVDRNISRLIQLMRLFPVIPFPASTGFRQPIHASQLADVALKLAVDMSQNSPSERSCAVINLGGDTTLTYRHMLRRIQEALPSSNKASQARLLSIPNRVFYAFCLPLLLFSPNRFAAVLRIAANLSGFTTASSILSASPKRFPLDLA